MEPTADAASYAGNANPAGGVKRLSVNPLKISQTVGGTLALQGVYHAMPILHGAQGCAAFTKALMTRHYREPVALQTSALQEFNVIFGGEASLFEALDTIRAKHNPDVTVVLSTALTDVSGEDIRGELNLYRKRHDMGGKLLSCAMLPDFQGSLESGYARTIEALLEDVLTGANHPKKKIRNRVNLLPGAHLTPGDVMELKEIISSFGLEVIALPDISTSLAGHLLTGHTPLSRGGVPLDLLKQAAASEWTIAVGQSMEGAAKLLEKHAEIPYKLFKGVTGLDATDDFFAFLQRIGSEPVSVKYRWQREFLMDAMLDAHFVYGGKKIALALEADHLGVLEGWFREMGARPDIRVAAARPHSGGKLSPGTLIGDLGDLEDLSADGVDLWVSNSHGEQGAHRLGVPFVPCGFPIFDRFGAGLTVSVGYRGTTEWMNQIGNQLLAAERRNHA
ncbi:nitrogenase iron-molybdenum cofactor biosynthesis protein NifN [Gorillibacterium timonense]|uniref:nitrogenase iron-molybdenum cofactor biosynthesis protein NifN n=1 Tax=Gorillibacterium timonense TaxID=1689269 RepID=UPI00071E1423|nr:nitrogenase iron-molybdenum cofactor biosynthesis protein NifN [Gorillibacterium timonense]